ncbi:MAG: TldD/PmbA family protein [Alphaproteobacteria bacterium]
MTQPDVLNLLQDLIAAAQQAGADSADAVAMDGASVSHAWRLGKTERLERSEDADIGLRVFVGRRQAMVSTTDRKPQALRDLAERAVAMARVVPEDPHSGLADPDMIATAFPDLAIDDPMEPGPDALIARAQAAEEAALAVAGVTNSEGAEAGWSRSAIALAASNGFAGSYARTYHSISVSVLAGEGTGMERDYDYSVAVFAEDLADPAELGRQAGAKAVRRLGPRKVKSCQVPVVFDPRVSGGLIGHLSGAISGAAITRGTSFLKDRLDTMVFAEGVTIVEDPHRVRGQASRPFDGEGLPTRRKAIVDRGRLTTWLLDLRSARQLGLKSTGNAGRGVSSPPSPTATNLWMEPGQISRDALIGGIERGLYITELIGMGVNGVTGDYSRGAAGFWIENGELAYPVSEITVAGNLKQMFANLTPADDLVFRYATNAPTLRIDGMTIAGD